MCHFAQRDLNGALNWSGSTITYKKILRLQYVKIFDQNCSDDQKTGLNCIFTTRMVKIFVKISTLSNIFTFTGPSAVKYFGKWPIYPTGTLSQLD